MLSVLHVMMNLHAAQNLAFVGILLGSDLQGTICDAEALVEGAYMAHGRGSIVAQDPGQHGCQNQASKVEELCCTVIRGQAAHGRSVSCSR